jgi:hypothetical protein
MDENIEQTIKIKQVEEFDEKFEQAVNEHRVIVEFSLKEIQDNVALYCEVMDKDDEIKKAMLQHHTESYMRDMKELGENIEASEKDGTLKTNNEIGIDKYSYYYIRKAEIDGLSEQEIADIKCQKLRNFGKNCHDKSDDDSPFSSPHDPDDDMHP